MRRTAALRWAWSLAGAGCVAVSLAGLLNALPYQELVFLPGYYYLHRRIPLYDAFTGRGVSRDLATVTSSVSHLLAADPGVAVPGHSLERDFGGVRILRRDAGPPVRQWLDYTPTPVHESETWILGRVDPSAPTPPANAGIRFAER